jgi:RNA polymerase sigma factor (sigma-70 family)
VPDNRLTVDAYADFELRDELWAALQQLPARMRAVLVLRYFEDLGEADTASVLGCSLGTVKSQCSRSLAFPWGARHEHHRSAP